MWEAHATKSSQSRAIQGSTINNMGKKGSSKKSGDIFTVEEWYQSPSQGEEGDVAVKALVRMDCMRSSVVNHSTCSCLRDCLVHEGPPVENLFVPSTSLCLAPGLRSSRSPMTLTWVHSITEDDVRG